MDGPSKHLVDSARNGSVVAVDQLLERHLEDLRIYVRLRCGPLVRAQESASDLVQSVCREILERLGDFEYRGEPAFRGWLFRVAERLIVDRARYYQRDRRDVARQQPQSPAGHSSQNLARSYATMLTPSRLLISDEDVRRIEAAFDRLPDRYREAILLSRVAGLSYADVAGALQCKPHYARTLLHRAVARLAKELGPDFAG